MICCNCGELAVKIDMKNGMSKKQLYHCVNCHTWFEVITKNE